jgi:hypothetical protein
LAVRSKGEVLIAEILYAEGFWVYYEKRLYFMNGIYQPVNLIVTCDGPDGGTDMEAIARIVKGVILPQVSGH